MGLASCTSCVSCKKKEKKTSPEVLDVERVVEELDAIRTDSRMDGRSDGWKVTYYVIRHRLVHQAITESGQSADVLADRWMRVQRLFAD